MSQTMDHAKRLLLLCVGPMLLAALLSGCSPSEGDGAGAGTSGGANSSTGTSTAPGTATGGAGPSGNGSTPAKAE